MSTAERANSGTATEARIAELEATVSRLVKTLEAAERRSTISAADTDAQVKGSRRNLLKLAAGAAAGGTAVALGSVPRPVAASDDDPLLVGQTTTQGNSGPTSTILTYVDDEVPMAGPLAANILTVRDDENAPASADGSGAPSAVAGYAFGAVQNGLYGYTASPAPLSAGVVAFGAGGLSVGISMRGSRANALLVAGGGAPPSRTDAHETGEVVFDSDGDLWFCVGEGFPGEWRKLAGSGTAGTFHAVTPFRVYDSRSAVEGGAGLDGSSDNLVSVKDARDVEDYETITIADAVPEGATAISANVVAINTTGSGFATINPGGDTSVGAAALNWGPGQTIGNAGIFRISSSRELSILIRGVTNIDLTLDVTGYWA